MLLLLSEHGDPSFLFQNSSSYNINNQLAKFEKISVLVLFQWNDLKDVLAHCYCTSLVRTLYMTWRVPRHVFQARAPSRNSTKYGADDLCGDLICEYFCWVLGDPQFFFGRSLPFLIFSIIPKNKKNLHVGSFNHFSYTIQIGSNWYMDTGVCDLEVPFFKADST